MNLHQISAAYVAQQDRLLLRFSTTTKALFGVWLTRRLCLSLIPQLSNSCAQVASQNVPLSLRTEENQRLVLEHTKQQAFAAADCATPFDTTSVEMPLGQEPLLVTTVRLSPTPTGVGMDFIEQLTPEQTPRSVQITLNGALLASTLQLLEQELQKSGWQLPGLDTPQPGASGSTEAGVADAQEVTPPRYLN